MEQFYEVSVTGGEGFVGGGVVDEERGHCGFVVGGYTVLDVLGDVESEHNGVYDVSFFAHGSLVIWIGLKGER